MKYLKMLGLAAVAAMALTVFTASSASATTLEVGGTKKNEAVSFSASLESGTSMVLSRTDGSLANTCTTSTWAGTTASPFTGTTVTGALSTLTFENCTRPVSVHKGGVLHFEHTSGTNGTVSWSGFEVTVGSPFGTLNCKARGPIVIGLIVLGLFIIEGILSCGFLVPSAKWTATYAVTSPSGLAVVA